MTDKKNFIQETEKLLNEMGKLAKIGAWELDTQTMQQLWTDETYNIHDVDKRTYNPNVNQEVSSFTPKSKPIIEKAVGDAINLGKPYDLVLDMVTIKGSHKIVRCIGNISRRKGRVVRVYGSVQDITEIKKAEEDLKTSEKKLKEAQELAHLGSWYWEVKTGSVEWSEEVYKIFRLDPDKFIPQINSILDLSPWPEDNKRNEELIDRAIKSREPGSYEQKFLRPDGSVGYYYSTFRGNYDANGNLVSIFGTVMDITERKQIEQRLKEIDKAKTEFVSLASHQLRTPLTAMRWYSEMLLHGDAGKVAPEQEKYLERIHHGTERMVALVNTILDVSRIELGTLQAEISSVDVVAIAEAVLEEQQPTIGEKNLKITRKFSKNIPSLASDPKFLQMIFQNLLANAVCYTPEGGRITIKISASSRKELSIQISDTGIGIPSEARDKIFTKMFRADNVQAKDTEGTGLGLYIVKSRVESLGGKVWFESEENKGAAFYVTLPL